MWARLIQHVYKKRRSWFTLKVECEIIEKEKTNTWELDIIHANHWRLVIIWSWRRQSERIRILRRHILLRSENYHNIRAHIRAAGYIDHLGNRTEAIRDINLILDQSLQIVFNPANSKLLYRKRQARQNSSLQRHRGCGRRIGHVRNWNLRRKPVSAGLLIIDNSKDCA